MIKLKKIEFPYTVCVWTIRIFVSNYIENFIQKQDKNKQNKTKKSQSLNMGANCHWYHIILFDYKMTIKFYAFFIKTENWRFKSIICLIFVSVSKVKGENLINNMILSIVFTRCSWSIFLQQKKTLSMIDKKFVIENRESNCSTSLISLLYWSINWLIRNRSKHLSMMLCSLDIFSIIFWFQNN